MYADVSIYVKEVSADVFVLSVTVKETSFRGKTEKPQGNVLSCGERKLASQEHWQHVNVNFLF